MDNSHRDDLFKDDLFKDDRFNPAGATGTPELLIPFDRPCPGYIFIKTENWDAGEPFIASQRISSRSVPSRELPPFPLPPMKGPAPGPSPDLKARMLKYAAFSEASPDALHVKRLAAAVLLVPAVLILARLAFALAR